MQLLRNNQAGFEAVGVIVAVLFVAVVGFAGLKVASMNKSTDAVQSSSASSEVPATIKTKADLAKTSKNLDASGSQLNSNLDDGSLDADLNTML